MLMTKEVPQVRIIVDQWKRFKRGHVFRPMSIGAARTMVTYGRAEWVDEPDKKESACIVPQEEAAMMESPKPRLRRKRK